jgi:putative two-component system response regulator
MAMTSSAHRGGAALAAAAGPTIGLVLAPSHPAAESVPARPRALVVDDDDEIRRVLRRLLEREGFDVQEADGVDGALEVLAHDGEVGLVISDLHMPHRNGTELLNELLVQYPDTSVIMVTGDGDVSTAVECLKLGAVDYLSKPIDLPVVRARVAKAMRDRARNVELRRLQQTFEEDLQREVRTLSHRNRAMFIAQVQMAVTMLEARDAYTRGHSRRVAEYSTVIGRQLDLDVMLIDELQLAGELHDIGKIGTPDAVLRKAGPLTAEEVAQIRRHTIDGEAMLAALRDDHPAVLQVVRSHHERVDGTGFPDGLCGNEISLLARIVSVADAFDAMTSTRTYRELQPTASAFEVLRQAAGAQFDPVVVTAFLATQSLAAVEQRNSPT